MSSAETERTEDPLFDQHRDCYEDWLDSDDPVERVLAEVLQAKAERER